MELIERWQLWAGLIEDLAAGKSPALDDGFYRLLHRGLLKACNEQAGRPRTALFQRIADMVQPWLTLPALSGIDRESLASLQKQCQAITQELGCVRSGWRRWAAGLLFLVLIAGGSYFLIEVVGILKPVQISAWTSWFQRNPLVTLAVLLPAALIASAVLLKKLLRGPRPDPS